MKIHQETFTERVLTRAGDRGDAEAFAFVRPHGTDRLTYAELDRRAMGIASWLQDRGLAGRQVLLLHPSDLTFVTAFVGCLYAGAVAVPAPLPTDRERHFERLSRIAADARVGAVLTTADHVDALRDRLHTQDPVPCLATDAGQVGDPARWRAPALRPDDLAFLQYTSGSTSAPKGVMVSHRNLMANEAAIQRALGSGSRSCFGSWLPLYHDMGLIGHVLQPLWLGARAALMDPADFMRRPAVWLEMIGDHGVTIGAAPNFAYDMCVRRVKDAELDRLDLSSWESACNGAEPVRADTIEAFTRRFATAGFRPEAFFPCYGMAETTLLVSGTPRGTRPATRSVDPAALETGVLAEPDPQRPGRTLVSSGVVHAEDFEVRIVDPDTAHGVPAGRVGEIWVRGASVAEGYWARPDATAETFGARLTDQEETDGWLRTGDLGALVDGHLYVTGRLKEMILVNGRNIYPHDVESTARSTDRALGTGAAFAVRSARGGRERLVVVLETTGLGGGPTGAQEWAPELVERVQAAVTAEFAVPAGNVLLVAPGTVRRTTSGKIQRTLMRRLFLTGGFEERTLYAVVEPEVRELIGPAPVTV
ncbi:fatty acyl-AMP ligase [Streptomyces yaanensis]|uniref:Fatty acyl-AMP ligase n=1 Tax=Streptomyces yaanensis TaxID=1142239 RepID=A0ABV7SG27_9ACTN|nr:fatty acyl-AMP ligase [Streptomyces sp. CGMCC 4.7035]WNB99309.1 fatty acyl-AMP ligase [Streptomyces sp. CGMCC 4.7035]